MVYNIDDEYDETMNIKEWETKSYFSCFREYNTFLDITNFMAFKLFINVGYYFAVR